MAPLTGHVLTPAGFVRGEVHVDGGRIVAVDGAPVDEATVRSSSLPIVLPGFVDLHVHGGGGHDTMAGGDAAADIARCHARHGTTALLATTMTAPADDIAAALRALAPHVATRPAGGARILGVHLEGPFLNPGRLGAQPPNTAPATLDAVLAWHALAPLRLVTIAPELPGHLAVVDALRRHGWVVQIGHSAGSYDDGVAALAAGAGGFTHLFNAMTPLHHRAPGIVGAALAHARHAEVIPDLEHVHAGAIRVALRCIDGLYCVTDATAAAGMPDGAYRLGAQPVTKCANGVRLADGTLAGSALTMDQALRNLVAIGLSLADASRRCSAIAAAYIGEHDRGRLAIGAHADAVVVDAALVVRRVVIEGEDIACCEGT